MILQCTVDYVIESCPSLRAFMGTEGKTLCLSRFVKLCGMWGGWFEIVAHFERLTVMIAPYSLISGFTPYRGILSVSSQKPKSTEYIQRMYVVCTPYSVPSFQISKPRMSLIDLNHGSHPSTPQPLLLRSTLYIQLSHLDTSSTSISMISTVLSHNSDGLGNETGIHKITYRVAFVSPWMWACRSWEWVTLFRCKYTYPMYRIVSSKWESRSIQLASNQGCMLGCPSSPSPDRSSYGTFVAS